MYENLNVLLPPPSIHNSFNYLVTGAYSGQVFQLTRIWYTWCPFQYPLHKVTLTARVCLFCQDIQGIFRCPINEPCYGKYKESPWLVTLFKTFSLKLDMPILLSLFFYQNFKNLGFIFFFFCSNFRRLAFIESNISYGRFQDLFYDLCSYITCFEKIHSPNVCNT